MLNNLYPDIFRRYIKARLWKIIL